MSALEDKAARLRAALDELAATDQVLHAVADAVAEAVRNGGKVLVAGNGGSAAEAQHLSSELTGRLCADRERPPIAAIALHADSSTVTALANDYGYDHVFARQVEALGATGDVLVVLSTSGRSPNLLNAVEVAQQRGLITIGFVGANASPLHDTCTHVVAAPSTDQQVTQECHLLFVHALVEMIEDRLA
jgi:D-sedoheptulose 7-phosphate isomerase